MDVLRVPHACIAVGPNNLLLNLDDHCNGTKLTKGPGNENIYRSLKYFGGLSFPLMEVVIDPRIS